MQLEVAAIHTQAQALKPDTWIPVLDSTQYKSTKVCLPTTGTVTGTTAWYPYEANAAVFMDTTHTRATWTPACLSHHAPDQQHTHQHQPSFTHCIPGPAPAQGHPAVPAKLSSQQPVQMPKGTLCGGSRQSAAWPAASRSSTCTNRRQAAPQQHMAMKTTGWDAGDIHAHHHQHDTGSGMREGLMSCTSKGPQHSREVYQLQKPAAEVYNT